jgi:hypothetical protein
MTLRQVNTVESLDAMNPEVAAAATLLRLHGDGAHLHRAMDTDLRHLEEAITLPRLLQELDGVVVLQVEAMVADMSATDVTTDAMTDVTTGVMTVVLVRTVEDVTTVITDVLLVRRATIGDAVSVLAAQSDVVSAATAAVLPLAAVVATTMSQDVAKIKYSCRFANQNYSSTKQEF